MDMRKNIQDVYKVLTNDETLLRLLYYKPQDANDSPLATNKPNILSMDAVTKWNIIKDVIKPTSKTDDLAVEPKCRIYFYPARRISSGSNYLFANQQIVFDVMVHFDFEEVDLRLEWICDRINELLFNQRITGFGKISFVEGGLSPSPEGYLGYRLIYKFTSENE